MKKTFHECRRHELGRAREGDPPPPLKGDSPSRKDVSRTLFRALTIAKPKGNNALQPEPRSPMSHDINSRLLMKRKPRINIAIHARTCL